MPVSLLETEEESPRREKLLRPERICGGCGPSGDRKRKWETSL